MSFHPGNIVRADIVEAIDAGIGALLLRIFLRLWRLNAGRQTHPKAGAQRTLEGVGCMPLP
jgi:hypothetical protein